MSTISLDYETFYDEDCSVKDLAPRAYIHHPGFYPYMVSVTDGAETWVGDFKDFNVESLRGNIVVSHNAFFERTIATKVWGTPEHLGVTEWNCTANLSSFLCGRRALGDAVFYLFGHQLSKALRSYMKGRHWADVRKTPQGEQLLNYAKDDALWCWRIWNDFLPRWSDFERQLSLLTLEAAANGVRVDRDLLLRYHVATLKELFKLEQCMPWVQRGGLPTSPKAIAEECRIACIPCPPIKDEDEELYLEWETTYKTQFDWVLKVGQWRSTNKLQATLKKMIARTDRDGEMDTPLKYFGAHTGRWSGDSGINFQNFRKDVLVCDGVEVDMRPLFVARPGCDLAVVDLSQIEPRCLAWCIGDTEFLAMVAQGMSPYEAHARATMGWTGGKLKEEDPDTYALAKARILALGYGCGAEKFITMAWDYCELVLTLEESDKIVRDFRAQNPRITAFWRELELGLNRSVGDNYEVVLPSGRMMVYSDVKRSIQVRTFKDPLTGAITTSKKAGTRAMSGKLRSFLYGGKLCENYIQAMARDVFGLGLLRLRAAGHKILFHVHDEVIVEVPEGTPIEAVTQHLEHTPNWAPGLSVAAEGFLTKAYRKG
jgi:hypothetical protein